MRLSATLWIDQHQDEDSRGPGPTSRLSILWRNCTAAYLTRLSLRWLSIGIRDGMPACRRAAQNPIVRWVGISGCRGRRCPRCSRCSRVAGSPGSARRAWQCSGQSPPPHGRSARWFIRRNAGASSSCARRLSYVDRDRRRANAPRRARPWRNSSMVCAVMRASSCSRISRCGTE